MTKLKNAGMMLLSFFLFISCWVWNLSHFVTTALWTSTSWNSWRRSLYHHRTPFAFWRLTQPRITLLPFAVSRDVWGVSAQIRTPRPCSWPNQRKEQSQLRCFTLCLKPIFISVLITKKYFHTDALTHTVTCALLFYWLGVWKKETTGKKRSQQLIWYFFSLFSIFSY